MAIYSISVPLHDGSMYSLNHFRGEVAIICLTCGCDYMNQLGKIESTFGGIAGFGRTKILVIPKLKHCHNSYRGEHRRENIDQRFENHRNIVVTKEIRHNRSIPLVDLLRYYPCPGWPKDDELQIYTHCPLCFLIDDQGIPQQVTVGFRQLNFIIYTRLLQQREERRQEMPQKN